MEVALQQDPYYTNVFFDFSFNPCFNGSCSATYPVNGPEYVNMGFNPCFNGSCSATMIIDLSPDYNLFVSILVLMEVALQQIVSIFNDEMAHSFNPCFNGSCSATEKDDFEDLYKR